VDNRRVKFTHSFVAPPYLEFLSAVAAGADLGVNLVPIFNSSDRSIQDNSSVKLGEPAQTTVQFVTTLGTNLLSTGLIAWKAWCVRAQEPN
jgi:hypothetical protein